MQRIEKTVFISYRRTNIWLALAIYQNLTVCGYDVFFDYININNGDFEQVILGNIKARAHFLVVLTPSALNRCAEPGDWFRREIETAMETQRNIVPLMTEGFDFGSPSSSKYLTGKLAKLKNYNGLSVPAEYFEEAMRRLRERFLNVPLEAVLHPMTEDAQQAAMEQQVGARSAPVVLSQELSAGEWFEQGFMHGETGNFDEAVRCYSKAIHLKPDYAEAYNNRGVTLKKKGDLNGAIQDFNQAIRFKPDYAEAYNNRGNARRKKSDLNGAIQDYNQAIRLNPDYAEAYSNRGNGRREKGDMDGAVQDFIQAISLKPKLAEAYNNQGIALYEKGDPDGAIQSYNEAIHLERNYANAYYNRGNARRKKSDLNGAIQDYNQAIRLNPDYAEAYNNRGNACGDKGNLDEAIQNYTQAIRLKPDYTDAINNLAEAQKEKKS